MRWDTVDQISKRDVEKHVGVIILIHLRVLSTTDILSNHIVARGEDGIVPPGPRQAEHQHIVSLVWRESHEDGHSVSHAIAL